MIDLIITYFKFVMDFIIAYYEILIAGLMLLTPYLIMLYIVFKKREKDNLKKTNRKGNKYGKE